MTNGSCGKRWQLSSRWVSKHQVHAGTTASSGYHTFEEEKKTLSNSLWDQMGWNLKTKPKWLQIMGLRFQQNSGIPLGGVWSQHGVCSQLLFKWEGRNKKEVNVTCTHLGSPNPTQGNVTPNTLSSFQSGRYIPLWFQYNSHNLLLPSLT